MFVVMVPLLDRANSLKKRVSAPQAYFNLADLRNFLLNPTRPTANPHMPRKSPVRNPTARAGRMFFFQSLPR